MGVNLGALWLLADVVQLPELASSALAVEASIVSNFLLNDVFTFRDRRARARAGFTERLVRYNLVSLVGLAIQVGTFALARFVAVHGLHREALGGLKFLAQMGGIALATAWNFAGNLRFTWTQAGEEGAR